MKLSRQGITTSVGYSFAFAALCSLAVSPGVALADEAEGGQESSASSEPIVSDQANNASVASEKSETVYVFANPDGTVKNVEVSTTLKNPYSASDLADASDLSDIENKESDSTYSGSGSNMVWNAAGENIYYSGKSSKQAPVAVKVTYFLDGKKVPYDKLAGASGKLKIRFDYENNATVKANIRGNEETLYVPFTFITAMIFDNENFKNAEVVNGKLIDDGDRAIVAGYAMPGLKKSLGSIVDDFDIPDYFEVTADVTDFDMKSSLTIATAGLMEDMNTDDLDMSELEDASGELNDAMGKIIDGAGTLKKGLDKLASGAKSADVATGKLASGAEVIAKGNKQLANGLDTMKEKTSVLPDSVSQLATYTSDLAAGVKQASDGVNVIINGYTEGGIYHPGLAKLSESVGQLVTAATGLKTEIETMYSIATDGGSLTTQSVDDAVAIAQNVKDEVAELNAAIETTNGVLDSIAGAVESASDSVRQSSDAISGIDVDAIEDESVRSEIQSQVDKAEQSLSDAQGALESANDSIRNASRRQGLASVQSVANASDELADALIKVQADSPEVKLQKIAGIIELGPSGTGKDSAYVLSQTLETGLQGVGEGVDKTVVALEQLNDKDKGLPAAADGASKISDGAAQLNAMVPTLIAGVAEVTDGAETLASGSKTLAKGADKLADGMGTLAGGTKSAASGSGDLVSGLETFADEGIGAITDKIDNDLLPFTDRLDAISQAGKDYNNFAGITKGTKGNVKFIIETDPIEKDDK